MTELIIVMMGILASVIIPIAEMTVENVGNTTLKSTKVSNMTTISQ